MLEYLLGSDIKLFWTIIEAQFTKYKENKYRSIPGPPEMAPPVQSHLGSLQIWQHKYPLVLFTTLDEKGWWRKKPSLLWERASWAAGIFRILVKDCRFRQKRYTDQLSEMSPLFTNDIRLDFSLRQKKPENIYPKTVKNIPSQSNVFIQCPQSNYDAPWRNSWVSHMSNVSFQGTKLF